MYRSADTRRCAHRNADTRGCAQVDANDDSGIAWDAYVTRLRLRFKEGFIGHKTNMNILRPPCGNLGATRCRVLVVKRMAEFRTIIPR